MEKTKTFKPCKVCLSPYRAQIEAAWKRSSPIQRDSKLKNQLFQKYHTEFGTNDHYNFNTHLNKHFAKAHYNRAKLLLNFQTPPDSPFSKEYEMDARAMQKANVSLAELSQSLLNIGAQMAEYYTEHPLDAVQNLNFRDIMAAQDSITKRMMVETQKDMVKIQMARLFSGQMPKEFKFIDGELDDKDDSKSLIRLLSKNQKWPDFLCSGDVGTPPT